jgi:hypothetical protein
MTTLKRFFSIYLGAGWLTGSWLLVVLTLSLLLSLTSLAAASWFSTGSMGTGRVGHTATLLPNGQVIVAGGVGLASAELYNPAAGTWIATANNMGTERVFHTATLLPNGKVLVAGGDAVGNSAELYDPATDNWVPATNMTTARSSHTATLLQSGKLLVVGGDAGGNSAELYDPAADNWVSAGNMGTAREGHTATLLPNGKVLVVGGRDHSFNNLASAELYDPASNTWSGTDSMGAARWGHTAALLASGKVLVAGGSPPDEFSPSLASAELYDPAAPANLKWNPTGPMGYGRCHHTANLLLSGKVLVAGGSYDIHNDVAIAELYDRTTGTWSAAGTMGGTGRYYHTATRLASGRVLVAGGFTSNTQFPVALDSAELYEPNVLMAKLPKALLAFYRFEGDPMDVSGNRRHAKVTGDPPLVQGFPDQGLAYLFNGTTDYLTAPLDINPSHYPKLTMGCWAKTVSTWPLQQLLTNDNGSFDRSIGIDFRGNGIGWSAFGGPEGQVVGAVPAILDQWTFLAVVYDQTAQTVKFQVDDMVFTKTNVPVGSGLDQFFIGASPAFNVFFAGAIDNVFVFGDALTDEQLAYIRSGGAQAIMMAARKANPGIFLLLMD